MFISFAIFCEGGKGVCREGMFSITSANKSCAQASLMGSTKLKCDTCGRQCPCRPSTFPTAICDDFGSSSYANNEEGENCNAHNFDVQCGWDIYNNNTHGDMNYKLQSEAGSCNCTCHENVIGTACEHCVPAQFAFLNCLPCACDSDGTTDDVCNQAADDFCNQATDVVCNQATDDVCNQATVEVCNQATEDVCNQAIDVLCNPATDDVCNQATNDVCNQATAQCCYEKSPTGQIISMKEWTIVNVETNGTLSFSPWTMPPYIVNDSVISVQLADQKVVYFKAPDCYLGNRLTSYGENLSYSILFWAAEDSRAIAAADVIIGGCYGFIVYNSVEQPPAQISWTHAVRLFENEFTNLDGSPVSRDQFMKTLVNIESIYIRATYEDKVLEACLISVYLDIGEKSYDESVDAYHLQAAPGGRCQDPEVYSSLCSGFCVPCQWSGHSSDCYVNIGEGLDSTYYTMGNCYEPGSHGHAAMGTQCDCLSYVDPRLYVPYDFATSCVLSANGTFMSNESMPVYCGNNHGFCTGGYYSVPDEIPYTFDEFGMYHYHDHTTGTCVCQSVTIEEQSNLYASYYGGLSSGQAYTPCDYVPASEYEQCNLDTDYCKSCSEIGEKEGERTQRTPPSRSATTAADGGLYILTETEV